MKYSQQIGILAALLLIGSCFLPWIEIPSLHRTLTGIDGKVNENLNFGKPILIHSFCCVISIFLFLLNKIRAKIFNIFFCFLNLGWALKNVILFNSCRSGECPVMRIGLYLVIILAVVMQVMSFLPTTNIQQKK